MLREQYPKSPILFLADDDAYLEAQLNKRLRSEYGVHELYKVLDGERTLESKFGPLSVRADLHDDADGGTPLLTVGITAASGCARWSSSRTPAAPRRGRRPGDRQRLGGASGRSSRARAQGRPEAPRLTDLERPARDRGMLAAVVEQVGAEIKAIEDAHELAQALAAVRRRPGERRLRRGRRQGR
jgi:hypothetical protein